MDELVGARVQRQIPRLLALAGDLDMRNAAPRLPEILHFQLAQLLAAQRVEEQRRQDGAVALLFDGFFAGRGVLAGCHEQLAGLVVAERRCLAFAALGPGPLDAFDRVVADSVLVTEILEQRGQRRQTVSDRGAAKGRLAPGQVVASGDDDAQTAPKLPTKIIRTGRVLTAEEFNRLSDVPPEREWFRNIRNPSTRRAYENAIRDFMQFTGVARPEEFRTVTRAHGHGGILILINLLSNKLPRKRGGVQSEPRDRSESGLGTLFLFRQCTGPGGVVSRAARRNARSRPERTAALRLTPGPEGHANKSRNRRSVKLMMS